MIAGGVSAESQAPLKVSGQKLPVKTPSFIFNLVVGFAIGVCTYVMIGCTRRLGSREIIVAAEQLRSLPEDFWVIRRL